MPTVDLSAHRLAPLSIGVGGGIVYAIRPSADDLRRMGVFTAAAEAAIREGTSEDAPVSTIRDRMAPEDYELLDSDEALARVQLGADAYERMVADGIPAPDIHAFGRYSMNYHTKGKAVADAILAIGTAASEEPEPDEDTTAEFPKASKSGRSTASGNPTRTASTGGTGRSRSTSGRSNTRGVKKR